LLSGRFPFEGTGFSEKICKETLIFPNNKFSSVSESAKDLMRLMLDKKSVLRIKADGVLKHPWFEEQKVAALEQNKTAH